MSRNTGPARAGCTAVCDDAYHGVDCAADVHDSLAAAADLLQEWDTWWREVGAHECTSCVRWRQFNAAPVERTRALLLDAGRSLEVTP